MMKQRAIPAGLVLGLIVVATAAARTDVGVTALKLRVGERRCPQTGRIRW